MSTWLKICSKMQSIAQRKEWKNSTSRKILRHTSKTNLTKSTTPLGIVLLGGIMAAMSPTRQNISSIFTWANSQFCFSNLDPKFSFEWEPENAEVRNVKCLNFQTSDSQIRCISTWIAFCVRCLRCIRCILYMLQVYISFYSNFLLSKNNWYSVNWEIYKLYKFELGWCFSFFFVIWKTFNFLN